MLLSEHLINLIFAYFCNLSLSLSDRLPESQHPRLEQGIPHCYAPRLLLHRNKQFAVRSAVLLWLRETMPLVALDILLDGLAKS